MDAAAGGPLNVFGDVAALAVAIAALSESRPDTASQCKQQKKKCKEATPQNIRSALAPNGRLHNVGAVLKPLGVPAFSLISGQKSVSGSPTGSPAAIDSMLEFSARHSVAPITEIFPMSKVNDALERLRSGQARYRVVLVNDIN